MPNEEQILKRPLYVFDLPESLLSGLALKAGRETPSSPPEAIETSVPTTNQDGDATATSCGLCRTNSTTVEEQRAHVRSDFHRFNLKRKIGGQVVVSEAEFEKMLEDLNESISGSDNDSESSGDDNDPLSTLLRRKARIANESTGYPRLVSKMGPGKAPIIWYSSPLLPPTVSLGVYRALFSNIEQEEADYISGLQSSQLETNPQEKPPHIFMCMIGGGHFAAMVVSLAPKNVKKQGASEREVTVLAHKTFHRYTTRRKQGGAQSSNDAAKGNAQSAGAQIRRYNEAMLTTEVRDLLASWQELVDTAKFIFIRATGSANRRTLFGYEGAPLRGSDPRIRGFPFTTRRATQSELLRCFMELTRVKVSRIDEAALAALSEKLKKPSETQTKPPKPEIPKLTKEEESQILHSTQLTALIRRSKAAALLSYLTTNKLSADSHFHPPNHHSPTLLHFAASSNSPAVVSALLTKAGSDPTCTTPDQPKTPFELAGDRATRDAFRVARADLGEAKWDWTKARVPAPLTKKQAEEREIREKTESEKEEKSRREKELEKLKLEEAKNPTKVGSGRSLVSSVVMGLGRKEEEERGLTPEARMRLERERRARAAEERMRKLQGR